MSNPEENPEDQELRDARALLETRFDEVEDAWTKLVKAGSLRDLAESADDLDALRVAFVRVGPPEPLPDPGPLLRLVQTLGRYWLEAILVLWLVGLGAGWHVKRSSDSDRPSAFTVNLEDVGEGPLSAAAMEALEAELRSSLENDDTASLSLRLVDLTEAVLLPVLRELHLPRHVALHALGRPPVEDSATAASVARWIQRERSPPVDPAGTQAGMVLRFEAASADLPPAALQRAAESDLEAQGLYVVVGSADRSGEVDLVPDLPQRRAQAVADIFLGRNVGAERIVLLVRPATALPVPIAAGTAEPENRRVEVWVR